MSERGRILLVHDDVAEARELHELLERHGYAVGRASSGAAAVQACGRAEPDLVLLDAQLPDAPAELLRELGRRRHDRDIPVIYMTTLDDAETHMKGLESGDDLLIKPFDAREVLARVERQVTVARVRTALRASEAEFRSVMASAVDAIVSADAEGTIRSWNSAATELFGHRESEVIGRPLELIIPERFRAPHAEGVRRVSSGGASHVIGSTVELAALRKDGEEFPIELSLATWVLDDKRYYTGIIRDISERKQAELKFRSVTDSAIDAIVSADRGGTIIGWNQAATRILGFTEEEAVGQPLELFIPDRHRDAHRAGLARVVATGEGRVIGTTVELTACTKAGEEIPIELSLSTWMVHDERYFTGILRDIGERKRAEEALRASERAIREKSRELEAKNQELVSTLARLSEAQEQLILQEKMVSLGKLSAGMAHELNNPASAVQRSAAQLQQALSRLHGTQLRVQELSLDPAQREELRSLESYARDRAVKPAELNAIGRIDRETAIQDWLVAQGVEAPWDLVPDLVELGCEPHDLQEMAETFRPEQLAVVLEWMSRIRGIYSLVAEIGLGAGRVTELVGALKSYTYMDRAPIQEVDVREGLDNTLIVMHNKLKAGITVRREYQEDLPRIQAHGSELNQVWTNIIDNAVDAMEGRGTLVLRAFAEPPFLVVEIEDDGPGIPEELRTRIFDPFVTTKPPGKGTGMGLNISRNIVVSKHEGKIDVESGQEGTRFRVCLPLEAGSDGTAPVDGTGADATREVREEGEKG